jgi:hypothetical protein
MLARCLTSLFIATLACAVRGQEPFVKIGVPFLEKHCTSCHGAEKQKADLALHEYRDDLSLLKKRKIWKHVIEMVESEEMPPDDKPQPTKDERAAFVEFLELPDPDIARYLLAGDVPTDPRHAALCRVLLSN